MKRDIITIDQKKCNGCAACIPNCPEGALQIINGKACLVSDLLCDGLGACIKRCPQDAITIEQLESKPYDERQVMEHIVRQGADVVRAHLKHLSEHGQHAFLGEAISFLTEAGIAIPDYTRDAAKPVACGCAGSQPKTIERPAAGSTSTAAAEVSSQLATWPVQLHLVNPRAAYLKKADLLIAADCTAFAYGNFHQRFMRGRVPIIFCPKLDHAAEAYTEKLAQVIALNDIASVTLVRMEVPCCDLESIVTAAIKSSGKQVIIKEYTISIDGSII
jgi:ferredoxin